MIDFYVYHLYVCNYAPNTLWVWIYAVRYFHMVTEIDFDLKVMARLKIVQHGWQRNYGAPQRKLPVTVPLIRDVFHHGGLSTERWDDLMVLLAIVLAFSFLWRSCEYAMRSNIIDFEKCLRIEDSLFALDDCDVSVPAPLPINEYVCYHRTHKSDFLHQGSSNNLYIDEGTEFCPIRLLNLARSMRPSHFDDGKHFLLQCDSGRPVRVEDVQEALQAGAERLSLSVEDISSHSLRAGGATAMSAMGKSDAEIQERGRWKSLCFKIYVWASRAKQAMFGKSLWATAPSLFANTAAARR